MSNVKQMPYRNRMNQQRETALVVGNFRDIADALANRLVTACPERRQLLLSALESMERTYQECLFPLYVLDERECLRSKDHA